MYQRLLTFILLCLSFTSRAQFLDSANTTCGITSNGNTSTVCVNWQDYLSAGPDLDSVAFVGVVGNTVRLNAYTHDYGACTWILILVNMNTTRSVTLPANYVGYNIEITEQMLTNVPCGGGSFSPQTPFLEASNAIVCSNANTPCTASMTYSSNGCVGVFVNTSAPGYTNALWIWGDGTTSSNVNQTATHTYPSSGVYYPQLVVTYTNPATGVTCTDTSLVGQLPVNCGTITPCNANFTATNLSNGTVNFTNTSTPANTFATAFWNFGDGSTSNSINPVHTYTVNGNYLVCLISSVPNTTGALCTDTFCTTISINNVNNSPCNISITGNVMPLNGVYNYTISAVGGAAPYSYQFIDNFNNASTNTSGLFSYSYAPGSTVVWYTIAFDSLGCSDTISNTFIVPGATPCTATMSYSPNGCTGVFINTSATGYTNALWIWGDGTTSLNNNTTVLHNYPATGVYYPILVVTYVNPNGIVCTDSSVMGQIFVNCGTSAGCTANFTSTMTSGNTFNFTNTSTPVVANYSLQWSFGDGTVSTANNPIHTYAASGVYTVCLIYSTGNTIGTFCSDTVCQVITAQVGTVACAASYTYNINPNNTYFFTSTSAAPTGYAYYWNFGNGATATGPTAQYNFGTSGTYNVCLYIMTPNNIVCDSICQVIIVGSNPQPCNASFTASMTSGNTFNFTNTSTPVVANYSLQWSFGDGTVSTANNPIHTYAASGVYTVCLIYSTGNTIGTFCSDTVCQVITAQVGTVACAASYTYNVNPNNTYFFTSTSTAPTGYAYYWNFGNGATATGPTAQYNFGTSGTYNVCLYIMTPNNIVCDSICQVIIVGSNPQPCNASFTASMTSGNTFNFTNTSTPVVANYSLQWSFGDGTVSTANNPIHTYTASGVYTVCLIYSTGNTLGTFCSDTVCQVITAQVGTVACAASYTYNVNPNNTYFFTSTSTAPTGYAYYWNFGNGATATGPTAQYNFGTSGTYNVCLYIMTPNNIVCDSICQVIIVGSNPQPCNASFTFATNNTTASFTNTSTAQSGAAFTSAWYFGDGFTSTLANPIHTYASQGTYTVCLVILAANNCIDSICQVVTVSAPNGCQANFTATVNQCSATLVNTSMGNATNGYWFTGNTVPVPLNPATQTYTQNFTANGAYTICLAIFTPGTTCLDTVCLPVVIFNCPTSIDDLGWAQDLNITPNPTSGIIQLNLSVQKSSDARVQVLDALGRVLISDNYQLDFGKNTITLNSAQFAEGTYMVRISGAQGGTATLRFIKQ